MKDLLIIFFLMLLIVVGFYAFQLLVLLAAGFAVYWCLPVIKSILDKRPK